MYWMKLKSLINIVLAYLHVCLFKMSGNWSRKYLSFSDTETEPYMENLRDGKFNQILFRNHRRLFQGTQLYQEYLHWYKTMTPHHVYFSPFNTARSHESQIAGSCELEPHCCIIFCCKKLFLISYIFSIHKVSKGLSVLFCCRRSVQRSISVVLL